MTYNDIVLAALRTAGKPLASHQIYEHPACEGMTRQQVSSAVGHLRHAGKIRETWEPVPGPPHGPKQVRQYEIMPQEDGLDAALIAALAASAAPDPDSPAGQAEASRLAAARVPQAERPIRRTSYTPPQAAAHPFKQPIPSANPRRGRITRDLPGHLRTPDPDPDGATQEAQFIAAAAEAEAKAEAATLAEAPTGPEAETAAEAEPLASAIAAHFMDVIDSLDERLGLEAKAPPLTAPPALSADALLIHTDLDTDLARELATAQPDPITTPTEDAAIAAKTHHCSGQCQGPDQGQTARHAPHGDPCATHADPDWQPAPGEPLFQPEEIKALFDEDAASAAHDAAIADPDDRPAWVRDLQAWLGPLPVDLSLYQMGARFIPTDGPGELRMKINDDGGGPFLRLDAKKLALNSGELGRLDRYSRAMTWIFAVIQANSELMEHPRSRPDGLDTPRVGDDFWSLPLPDGSSHADGFRTHTPF